MTNKSILIDSLCLVVKRISLSCVVSVVNEHVFEWAIKAILF